MTRIPSHVYRVPNLLTSRLALSRITQSSVLLARVSEQIATGRAVVRPSDNAVSASLISVLDDRLERSTQTQRNLSHAQAALGVLDDALGEATELAMQARELATSQMSFGSSSTERNSQATVVDQLLNSLFNISNRQSVAGYMFGGSVVSSAPIQEFRGGYRYRGQGNGLTTDLGMASQVPITLGAGNAIGNTSARVRGGVDLDPNLTPDTRLSDLRGARGLGISLGAIEFSVNGGARVAVDLSGADTVDDVIDRLTAAIRQHEADSGVPVLDSGGISVNGECLSLDVLPGGQIEFFDIASGQVAADLGLTGDSPVTFTSGTPDGAELGARLTWFAPVSSLAGVTGALGSIRINANGHSAVVDLSSAQTLGDIRTRIEGANLGVRVAINADGTGIDIVNEVAGGRNAAMSIAEVAGSNLTATRLGIRSLAGDTRLTEFNDGRGVSIVDGATDPTTGTIDPTMNTDIKITLGDPAGTVIMVDLRPEDIINVQTVIDRINAEAATQLAAAGLPPGSFVAELTDSANGIHLRQDATFGNGIRIDALNNSQAAEQLGLLNGRYDAGSATFVGEDRATVRVDNLFTYLIDLRDALRANDTRGIELAAQGVERSIDRLAEVRGMVGGYAQRVDFAAEREVERSTLDEQVRSQLRDVDYTEAASRFTLLQTQLQAGLQVTAAVSRLTLLDYLG